jgi:general stress protein YciG
MKKKQGFAALDPDRLREISSKGGKVPRKEPTGFARLTPKERRELSRKGGLKSKRRKIEL